MAIVRTGYANFAAFPPTGAVDIIYVDLSNGNEFTWVTNAYVAYTPTLVGVSLGDKSSAWFTANPSLLLAKGQLVFLDDQSGMFKKGDGVTALSALSFLGGGSGVQSVSGNLVDNTDPLNPVVLTPTLQEVADTGADTTTPLTYNGVELATIEIQVTADLTAENDKHYVLVTSAIFTDPSPVTGKGYTILLNSLQTATVGGVAYGGTNGVILKRYYISGSWITRTFYSNSANVLLFEAVANKSSSYTASSTTTYANTKALVDGLAKKLSKARVILFTHSSLNPADASSYYFGQNIGSTTASGATSALRRGYAPCTGFIYASLVNVQVNSILGTTESSTVTLNNITAGTSVVLNSSVIYSVISNGFASELGTPFAVTAGDALEIKVDTPTWATNPTGVIHLVNVYIGAK